MARKSVETYVDDTLRTNKNLAQDMKTDCDAIKKDGVDLNKKYLLDYYRIRVNQVNGAIRAGVLLQ